MDVNNPNARFAATLTLQAMVDTLSERLTRLQCDSGTTRRGARADNLWAIDCLKQDRAALQVALEALNG